MAAATRRNFTPPSDIFDELRCTRLVVIDLIEYRLNPPATGSCGGVCPSHRERVRGRWVRSGWAGGNIDLEVVGRGPVDPGRSQCRTDRVGVVEQVHQRGGFLVLPALGSHPDRYRGDPIPIGNSKRTEPPTL